MSRLQLDNSQVHIWLSNLTAVEPVDLDRYAALLSVQERRRNRQITHPTVRHRDLLARALVRTSLSHYHPVTPEDWQFTPTATGKPYISDPDIPLYFNLSHSGDLVACAVCRHATVGLDLEQVSAKRRWRDIAQHYFSAAEVTELFGRPDIEQLDYFYKLWTLKEAYLKATGRGIGQLLSGFSFHFDNNRIALRLEQRTQRELGWVFTSFVPAENYRAALAVNPDALQHKLEIALYRGKPTQTFRPIPLALEH